MLYLILLLLYRKTHELPDYSHYSVLLFLHPKINRSKIYIFFMHLYTEIWQFFFNFASKKILSCYKHFVFFLPQNVYFLQIFFFFLILHFFFKNLFFVKNFLFFSQKFSFFVKLCAFLLFSFRLFKCYIFCKIFHFFETFFNFLKILHFLIRISAEKYHFFTVYVFSFFSKLQSENWMSNLWTNKCLKRCK